ncbi:hypothetical protein GJ496_001517 [Pomphorhynchus laevis]|nr:hypothetical protein GJ496_001517 [Pomphorhynchus laevis]
MILSGKTKLAFRLLAPGGQRCEIHNMTSEISPGVTYLLDVPVVGLCDYHDSIFHLIDNERIRTACQRTQGGAGPSGLDSDDCRDMLNNYGMESLRLTAVLESDEEFESELESSNDEENLRLGESAKMLTEDLLEIQRSNRTFTFLVLMPFNTTI